jgi:hypothetical protein
MEGDPKVRVFLELFILFSYSIALRLVGFGIDESTNIHSPLSRTNMT